MRTVWAIDRRILVDEVYTYVVQVAGRLDRALADATDVLHDPARALASYTDGYGPPLRASRWRGQVRIEPRAHHPQQPEVITSTVAQIGSRMLFRGYGVGERSLAIEAALGAVDCTICLDEAHLAEPFRRTVEAVRGARAGSEPPGAFGPLRLLTLSATPSAKTDPALVHTVSDADEGAMARRLDAPKVASLVEPASDRDGDQIAALLEAVAAHLEAGARRVACVVNTVQLAVLMAEQTAKVLGEEVERVLLIGPQRPFDRRRLLEANRAVISTARHRRAPSWS